MNYHQNYSFYKLYKNRKEGKLKNLGKIRKFCNLDLPKIKLNNNIKFWKIEQITLIKNLDLYDLIPIILIFIFKYLY